MTWISSQRRFNRTTLLLLSALVGLAFVAGAFQQKPLLRGLGWSLVAGDAIEPADLVVVAQDAGGAGVLEASDLVRQGVANRVAVFEDPPTGDDFEFLRRGLPYEDAAARQIRQFALLNITNVVKIDRADQGSTESVEALLVWCREHQVHSLVFVTLRDHSRRLRRLLNRTLSGAGVRGMVQPEHYSHFDPDRWWETSNGRRILIVEMQKLAADYLLHPF